jgi:membrane-bound serine protease (ClpP class)
LAKGIVKDVPALLEQVGLANAQTTRFEEQPAETLARYIVMVGPLLFSLALLAIFIEIRTPGFGIPGIIGICLLMIYFFGHYVAGLAGMEELALVVAGFVLLAIEVFVIPGFGITGILGITLILAGTVMAMVPHLPQVPQLPDMEPITFISYLEEALWRLLIMLVVSGIGLFLISKLLPRTSFYRRLILETALDHDSGYVSAETRYRDYIGRVGVAVTPLRPAGIAMLGDDRVDVVSNGDLVSKGAKVRVTEVQGRRVVVEAVSEDAD